LDRPADRQRALKVAARKPVVAAVRQLAQEAEAEVEAVGPGGAPVVDRESAAEAARQPAVEVAEGQAEAPIDRRESAESPGGPAAARRSALAKPAAIALEPAAEAAAR
jgi:hypothetical protein